MENFNPGPGQPQPASQSQENPGFIVLLKTTFQVFAKSWTHFLKLTLALILPFIVIGGLLFVAAVSKAAPKLPGPAETAVTETTESSGAANTEGRTIGDIIETIEANQGEGATGLSETGTAEGAMVDETADGAMEESDSLSDEDVNFKMTFPMGTSEESSSFGSVAIALMTGMATILMIVMIPLALYYFVIILAFIRLAVVASQGEEIHIGDIIKWSFKKLFSFIWLSLMVGVYVGWPFILVGIASSYLGTTVNIVLALAAFGYVIAVFPRVIFAQYVLAEGDKAAKEAFLASIAVAKGHWGKIVGYIFLLSLLGGIASGAITYSLKWIGTAGYILHILLSLFLTYIGPIFYYGLYSLCKVENESKA